MVFPPEYLLMCAQSVPPDARIGETRERGKAQGNVNGFFFSRFGAAQAPEGSRGSEVERGRVSTQTRDHVHMAQTLFTC